MRAIEVGRTASRRDRSPGAPCAGGSARTGRTASSAGRSRRPGGVGFALEALLSGDRGSPPHSPRERTVDFAPIKAGIGGYCWIFPSRDADWRPVLNCGIAAFARQTPFASASKPGRSWSSGSLHGGYGATPPRSAVTAGSHMARRAPRRPAGLPRRRRRRGRPLLGRGHSLCARHGNRGRRRGHRGDRSGRFDLTRHQSGYVGARSEDHERRRPRAHACTGGIRLSGTSGGAPLRSGQAGSRPGRSLR